MPVHCLRRLRASRQGLRCVQSWGALYPTKRLMAENEVQEDSRETHQMAGLLEASLVKRVALPRRFWLCAVITLRKSGAETPPDNG